MKFILPLLLFAIGSGAGVGAGIFLKPEAEELAGIEDEEEAKEEAKETEAKEKDENSPEYIQLNNQFVVPVVGNDMVASLVVLALGVEIEYGASELVYRMEPKLRDTLLQVLFDHANMGGFDGRFTDGQNMKMLRTALSEAAQSVLGEIARGVIITDIVRQDV